MSKTRPSARTGDLQDTQQPVINPSDQQVLLEITENLYGVNQRVREFTLEFNQPSPDWDVVINGLRNTSLGDLHYYLSHPDNLTAVTVFLNIFQQLSLVGLPDQIDSELQRTFLEFLAKLLESSQAENFQSQILSVLELLATSLAEQPSRWQGGSSLFHSACASFCANPVLAPSYINLFRLSLGATYQCWLDQFDLVSWYERNLELFSPGSNYSDVLESLNPGNWQAWKSTAEKALTAEELLALPDFSAIVDMVIQTVKEIDEPTDRAHFLVYLIDNPLFANYEHWLLSDLISCLRNFENRNPTVIMRFIPNFFSLLETHQFKRKAMAINCAFTLGEVLSQREEDPPLPMFIGHLVRLPFEAPDVRGVTDQWEVLINPHHLPIVRLYMRLVEINPPCFRQLLSALVLQLAIHGLFIKDTDLFQKDVSQLLNTPIDPIYQKVKQLARMFPVYFTEIGSEGELREVSTEIDQIQERKDPLIHFLRKQTHVESSSNQVTFTREVIGFWTTGDKVPLKAWLPKEVFINLKSEGIYFDEVHKIFRSLDEALGYPDYLTEDHELLERQIELQTKISSVEKTRAKLLLRLYKLLEEKYTFMTENITGWIQKSVLVKNDRAEKLISCLRNDSQLEVTHAVLDVLEDLKNVILDPEDSPGDERIYYKRHIGAGLPAMYGAYRERKFEALGMTFRLETLARSLFAELVSSVNLNYVTKKTLLDIHEILTMLVRALRIDGMQSASLENNLNLLAMGLQAQGFSVDQLVNVFQYIAADVNEITNRYVLNVHTGNLEIILDHTVSLASSDSNQGESKYSLSEKILRGLIMKCFGLQNLDELVGKVLVAMTNMRQYLDDQMRTLLMSYDPYRLLSALHDVKNPYDDPLHLGSKGYFLKRLGLFDMPVPEGFIITTELFRCQGAMEYDPFREDTRNRIREYLMRLESESGKRFGDARNPLLLSVRSSSVMSMPGMMSTFLNVGLNDEIAEELGRQEKYSWAVWDCYRRLIQSWAMSHGVDRDVFDEAIQNSKLRYGVEKKMDFKPEHMREIAFYYKEIMADHGISLLEKPFEQLIRAVQIVLESWFAERAEDYRQHLGIAEQWGTSVIVQRMVFGNLNKQSGSGVIMTRNPIDSEVEFDLYGDYNICSQGDDVVSGLVNPLPITESQQQQQNPDQGYTSLQRKFPTIYKRLEKTAAFLIEEQDYAHQEIEFTFESEQIQDLYILQTRNMVYSDQERIQVFVTSEKLKNSLLGRGIGAGGGAISGRVAFSRSDIQQLQYREPDSFVILLRPDTVPEDFSLIAQADGLLTARGGCTSHAAVAAQRLGKTCVVNCRSLSVDEQKQQAELDGHVIHFGDCISIDGRQGTIYRGEFPVQYEDIVL